MPLLTISSLPPADPKAIARMIREVRDTGAAAFECPRSNIWVMFEPVSVGHYLQGEGEPASSPQADTHPPIVIIRANAGRSTRLRDALVAAVAQAVGRGLSIPPENVWIHYQEMRPQDVWFGGRWSG